MSSQVVVCERLLTEEEHVHVPEAPSERGLDCDGRGEGMRVVDLDERKMAVREPHASAQLLLDTLDLSKRELRIRALVSAVLENQRRARWTADVIDRLVQRLQARRSPSRHGRSARQEPSTAPKPARP